MKRTAAALASYLRLTPPWVVLAAAAASWATLLAVVALGTYSGDVRAFVCLGERTEHPAALAHVPRTSTYGYDGQYYAALALDPLLRRPETVAALDAPLYRAGRIGVPLAAWLLAYGHPSVALVAYQVLCWSGCLLAVYLTAVWLVGERRPALWALAIALSAGLATSMFRSTPDGVAVALILLALLLHARGRDRGAVVALVVATLVRETSILASLAIAFIDLRQRRWRQALVAVGAPLLVCGAWQLYLRLHLAGVHADRGTGAFGVPFAWLPRKLSRLAETGLTAGRMELLGLIALAACFVALALVAVRFPRWTASEATFVAFGALAVGLGFPVYVEVYAHTRVLLALPALALLLAAGEPRRGVRRLLAAVAIAFAVTGVTVVRGELGLGTVKAALGRVAGGDTRVLAPDDGEPPVAMAPLPEPTAAPTPTPTPAPQPLWVLPVARTAGHFGAQWQTEMALANPTAQAATVRLELVPAGKAGAPRRVEVTLAPGEKRVVADTLGDLFGAAGAGAVRVVRGDPAVTVGTRTYDSAAKAPRGRFIDGIEEGSAFTPGRAAVLAGLGHDPGSTSRKRTNLGVLNVTAIAIELEVAVSDAEGRRIGAERLRLAPREFRQINDLFGAVGATAAAAGSARVTVATRGGAFLAYASVVRRDPPSVTYVLPRPARPPSPRPAGDAAAPRATPAAPSSSTASRAGASAPPSSR